MVEMSTGTKRGRPGYDREELLRICVSVFNEHGYDATSMDMLAKKLGVTKSAIYHHIKTKEEILVSALQKALEALEEVFDAAETLPAASSAEKVEFVVRQTVFVLVEQLDNVTLLLRLRGNTDIQERALTRRRQLTYRLSDLILAAQEDGELRQDTDSRTLARLTFGMINSLSTWYRPERGTDIDRLADTVAKMAFQGMLA